MIQSLCRFVDVMFMQGIVLLLEGDNPWLPQNSIRNNSKIDSFSKTAIIELRLLKTFLALASLNKTK